MANNENEEKTLTGPEKILVDMADELRPPSNEKEKELSDQIQAIKDKGRMVEIPPETL